MATAALVGLSLFSSVALPLLRVPDERFHVDMVLVGAQAEKWLEEGWPTVGERLVDPDVEAAYTLLRPDKRTVQTAIVRTPPKPLDELGDPNNPGPPNRMTVHPPLHYVITAVIGGIGKTLIPGVESFDLELWLYRVANVMMVSPLPLVFYLAASQVSRNQWVGLGAAVMPLAIPGLSMRNAAIVNNDNLLMLLSALVIFLCLRELQGDRSLKRAVLIGLLTGLAMLTKGFGFILLGVVAVTYLLTAWLYRDAGGWRQSLSVGLAALAVAGAVGGWWYVTNLVTYGRLQPGLPPRPPIVGAEPDWLVWATTAIWRPFTSFWGGSFTIPSQNYTWVYLALLVLSVVGLVVGITHRWRPELVIALLFTVLLGTGIWVRSAFGYVGRGRIGGLHGRYFYPGLVGTAPIVLRGYAALLGRAARWMPTTIVAAAMVMNLIAIRWFFHIYWRSGRATFGHDWQALLAWSPIGESWLIAITALTLLAFVVLLAGSVHAALKGRQPASTST